MSDIPMREMDLAEVLATLPQGHKARIQFGELTARLSREKDKVHTMTARLSREKDKVHTMKVAIEKSRAYLYSFIETEGSKDHYIESTGEYENCQVDFSEAQKALDLLGCDDDHGIDTSL